MANFKRFSSVATQIRTFEDKYDYVSFVVTVPDLPIQRLRETLNTMAAKLTKQIERRKELVKGAFIAFESVPAPAAESGSERLDVEHPHAHCLIAVPKGQTGSRRLEVFEQYGDYRVVTADIAISAVFYNCKASVYGSFTNNWQASLEHNFVQRAVQLSGSHRYRCTGIFRDRELPEHEQKSLEQIEADLNAAAMSSTDSTIPSIQHEQEQHTCVVVSIPPQLPDSRSMDSPLSTKQDTMVTEAFKSKPSAIAVGSSRLGGILSAAAKRLAVDARGFRCETSSWQLDSGERRPPPPPQPLQVLVAA
jgi:hypothetical protein